jgi:putative NADH-flavin reductase
VKYSVIGATGQTRGATARGLLEAHHDVRAVVRSQAAAPAWTARGAEAAIADLMSDMIDGFNSVWIGFEGGNAELAYGTTSLQNALGVLAERAA